MKNKKGFTVIELIVSFSLTVVVSIFLFQLVLVLQNMYNNSSVQTELLNIQGLISNKINSSFNEKDINRITKCGTYCLNFIYNDGSNEELKINYAQNKIQFGSYTTKLPKNSTFKEVVVDILYSGTFNQNNNNALLNLKIPINNDKFKDKNFGINVVYQFNNKYSNISAVEFNSQTSNYGYIQLLGLKDTRIAAKDTYLDAGFKIYDNNGDEINGYVEVNNPFDNLTPPYDAGIYEIKYQLKKDNNTVYETTRTITVIE